MTSTVVSPVVGAPAVTPCSRRHHRPDRDHLAFSDGSISKLTAQIAAPQPVWAGHRAAQPDRIVSASPPVHHRSGSEMVAAGRSFAGRRLQPRGSRTSACPLWPRRFR